MDVERLGTFFSVVFSGGSGVIEVRLIEDVPSVEGARREVIKRFWYRSYPELLDDLDQLRELAASKNAGVYYGVLARRAKGAGKAEDTLPGRVVWADLDFKDYAGGEKEARERLAAFLWPPSAIVFSGHGLHAYWLLLGDEVPSALTRVCRGLADALGGDHVHDAPRVMRLPGTYNRKDPESPIPVEFEDLGTDRIYNLSEIAEELEALGVAPDGGQQAEPTGEESEPRSWSGLTPRVQALIDAKPRIRNYFNGHGKIDTGIDGRTLDTSSSGYDFSFVFELAKAGVTDPRELAAALRHRPDGAADAKGDAYVTRSVARALERVERIRDEVESTAGTKFEVESMRILRSNPALYEITVQGTTFKVNSATLRSRSRFETAFLDALYFLPSLPGDADDYRQLVNGWLAQAEGVEMPPEASTEFVEQQAVQQAVEDLPLSADPADLDHDRAFELESGERVFKVRAVWKHLSNDGVRLEAHEICRHLRRLGYGTKSRTIGGLSIRAWGRTEGAQ